MRERATVLLVRQQAVLLVKERSGPWLLPGGSVEYDELAIVAAIRALHEETGVAANAAAFLFQQASAHHIHHVFRIAIPDDVNPRAGFGSVLDDLRWVDPSQIANMQTTPGTKAILNRALGLAPEAVKPVWQRMGASVGLGKRWR